MAEIISETQRKLQQVLVQENVTVSRDLPRDTVLKQLNLRLSGAIQTTFASGTPVADALASFDNICPRIDVIINGSRVVKSVRPYMMRMQSLLATGHPSERLSSAGAAAVLKPTVNAGFTYGTTTQYTTVAETIIIPFACIMSEVGGDSTYLNLKGVASAEIKFSFGSFMGFRAFGNTAPLAFANSTLAIDITTVENQSIPANLDFSDFKQTTKELTFNAETRDSAQEINRGNFLIGVNFLCRDGAAGTATTASGKLLSNNVLSDIKLVLNGQRNVKVTTWFELQAEMQSRYGLNAGYSGNVSPIDGFAYLNMLEGKGFGQLATALDVRPPLVDQVHLYLSTRPSSDVSYTNPASVTVMTNELVVPSKAK